MAELWFTADTHFGHANIIAYCRRPFATVRDMNEHVVRAWNTTVKPDDYVVHLGDVMMGLIDDAAPVLARLNGHKLVILGNHDTPARQRLFAELNWRMAAVLVAARVCFQHPPIEGEHSYKLVVHGHAHGTAMLRPKHFDVGVDVGNWQGASRMGRPVPASVVLSSDEERALRGAVAPLFWG